MTDNRTTELREKLKERGVEYQVIGKKLTYWNRDGSHNDCDDADYVAYEQSGSLTVEGLTPEQAIAATLGGGKSTTDVAEKVEELRLASLKFPANIRRKVNIALCGIEQAIAATLGSEREKALERLVRSLYADYHAEWPDRAEETYAERMKELGIGVIDE